MAIRRKASARMRKYRGKGRHPLLKLGSSYLNIYNYVKGNPGASSQEIKSRCLVNHQRISDMKDEGLLRVVGKRGRYNAFEVVEENIEGIGRDKVPIRFELYLNTYGEYSVKAKVVGGCGPPVLTPRPVKVLSKQITFTVPKPEEGPATQDGLIIDAEYTIIDA